MSAQKVGKYVSKAAMELVLETLEREADLDGLVTATSTEIAQLAGISQTSVSAAIRDLNKSGDLTIVGRLPVKSHPTIVVQLVTS